MPPENPATVFQESIKSQATPIVLHAYSFSSSIPWEYRFAIFVGASLRRHKSQNIIDSPPTFRISAY
jgi:hypothetical protein